MSHTAEGLPVPDPFEIMALFNAQFEVIEGATAPTTLAEQIMDICPAVERVVGHDYQMLGEELGDDMAEEEIAEMGFGVEHGYSIAIGAITYIYMLRSRSASLPQFTSKSPDLLPARSDDEVDRIRLVRSGHAVVGADHPDIEFIEDSRDLAHSQTGQYFFDSPDMEDFLEEEISRYRKSNERQQFLDQYCDGIRLGFDNAVGMYVQCFEQRALPK